MFNAAVGLLAVLFVVSEMLFAALQPTIYGQRSPPPSGTIMGKELRHTRPPLIRRLLGGFFDFLSLRWVSSVHSGLQKYEL
jgi:hypothetical protein